LTSKTTKICLGGLGVVEAAPASVTRAHTILFGDPLFRRSHVPATPGQSGRKEPVEKRFYFVMAQLLYLLFQT
jgi:hypothetical protein